MLYITICYWLQRQRQRNAWHGKSTQEEDVIAVVGGVPIPIDSEILNLTSKKITNIEWHIMKKCANLMQLHLDNNPIQNIEGVAVLKKLKLLNIARTYIRDISEIRHLDNLEELNLLRSFVTNIPSSLPKSLRKLYIDREIGLACIKRFKKTHPECEVYHDDLIERASVKIRGPLDERILGNPEKYIPAWARGLE
mgnify:CR=1 FL=1